MSSRAAARSAAADACSVTFRRWWSVFTSVGSRRGEGDSSHQSKFAFEGVAVGSSSDEGGSSEEGGCSGDGDGDGDGGGGSSGAGSAASGVGASGCSPVGTGDAERADACLLFGPASADGMSSASRSTIKTVTTTTVKNVLALMEMPIAAKPTGRIQVMLCAYVCGRPFFAGLRAEGLF